MQTRTKGISASSNGEKSIDKQYKGKRIYIRLGAVSQDEAEARLRQEQARIDGENSRGPERLFCDAAARYIVECQKRGVRTTELIAYHITLILPYVGMKSLETVHSGSFESFIDERLNDDQVTATTVNRSLEVARTILNRSARVWRDDAGKAWLNTAPLIEMLPETPRLPRPINWEEQKRLFEELPTHLHRMALFSVNTGLREENVCGLKWEWERKIPELNRSVFVVPASEYKGKRPHVVIMNDVAHNVMEACRGTHKEYVFTYHRQVKDSKLIQHMPDRVDCINNTAWQKARARAQLQDVRVHDLRHTFAQRLRDAGVAKEDRSALLGHAIEEMSEHYATPTVARLIEMANLVQQTRDSTTLLRIVNG